MEHAKKDIKKKRCTKFQLTLPLFQNDKHVHKLNVTGFTGFTSLKVNSNSSKEVENVNANHS